MEDALALSKEEQSAVMQGLNPCFNGRCTRTAKEATCTIKFGCLNPCFNGRCTRTTININIQHKKKGS